MHMTQRPKEAGLPETGFTQTGAGTLTAVLWKNRDWSLPRNHLSSPN